MRKRVVRVDAGVAHSKAEKCFKAYSKALPWRFPMAIYSVLGEKSTAVTVPRGVLEVGQLENTVKLGRCI